MKNEAIHDDSLRLNVNTVCMPAHQTRKNIANSQRLRKLTPAERTAKLLAFKPRSYFNAPVTGRTEPGTSAMARARAAI